MVSRAESLNIEHVYIAGALGSFRKANDASTAYRSYQENEVPTILPKRLRSLCNTGGPTNHELLYQPLDRKLSIY